MRRSAASGLMLEANCFPYKGRLLLPVVHPESAETLRARFERMIEDLPDAIKAEARVELERRLPCYLAEGEAALDRQIADVYWDE